MDKEQLTSEGITLVVRVAYEHLSYADMKEVFGKVKADKWIAKMGNFVELWYYATAIQQHDLLEIMNAHIIEQPIHAPRGEQL